MTRNADYIIDVTDGVLGQGRDYRRQLIDTIAPCSYGNISSPNLEPPQHWARDRWFLPMLRRTAENMIGLFEDGGRAAENYMRVRANPGDEVSIKLVASIERNPLGDWETMLREVLDEIYAPANPDAMAKLADIFLRAEDAYFNNSNRQGGVIEVEPLVGSSPGRPMYIQDDMDATGRENYENELCELYSLSYNLLDRVENTERLQLVRRCIERALEDLAAETGSNGCELDSSVRLSPADDRNSESNSTVVCTGRNFAINIPSYGGYTLKIRSIGGSMMVQKQGFGPDRFRVDTEILSNGINIIELISKHEKWAKVIYIY
jgi:hypothetical protein